MPSKATVVGLTGYAGVGKSTAANYLVERHGFTRLSFAGPLKKMLRTLNPIIDITDNEGGQEYGQVRVGELFKLGWTENQIKEDPDMGAEYRRLLQVLGTDCIRAVDPEFWVRAAVDQIGATGKYVFDDVRFPNEAEAIKGANHLGLWNLEAPGVHAANGHSSEQHAGRMGESLWLFNRPKDFEYLYDQIDRAVEMVLEAAK